MIEIEDWINLSVFRFFVRNLGARRRVFFCPEKVGSPSPILWPGRSHGSASDARSYAIEAARARDSVRGGRGESISKPARNSSGRTYQAGLGTVNATLRLLEHEYRTSSLAKDKNDYPKREDDTRFAATNVPITAIAVSGAQSDTGTFELNFRDERYLPFEGAGATSRWRIDLPTKIRSFDCETLTDVVLHVRFTAIDGGDKLRATASAAVYAYLKSVEELAKNEGLFVAFDLAHDFPDAWHRAKEPRVPAGERVIELGDLHMWLPTFTKAWKPATIRASDVVIASELGFLASIRAGVDDIALSPGAAIGNLKTIVAKEVGVPLTGWKLTVSDPRVSLSKAWLLVR